MFQVRRISLLCCMSASLLCPAFASTQELDQTNAEIERLSELVFSGSASDDEAAQLAALIKRSKDLVKQRLRDNSAQVRDISSGLDRLERQNNQVQQALFGGSLSTSSDSLSTPGLQSQNPDYYNRAPRSLVGGVSRTAAPIRHQIDHMVIAHVNSNPEGQAINEAIIHYSKPLQKIVAQGKDAFNFLIPYRGFGPSSEGGDVVLGEQLKLKSLAAAQYARQKLIDETHLKVTTAVLELAQEIGQNNYTLAFGDLTLLVGPEEAQKTLDMLLTYQDGQIPNKADWSVVDKQQRYQALVRTSLERDAIVVDIVRKVHQYNKHGKASMMASHIVMPTLGVLRQVPNFIGPVASSIMCGYVMITGGPEDCKLLKELYLDKRLESRSHLVSEEAHLALDSYETAVGTKNPVLLYASQSIIEEMMVERIGQVL